MSVVAQLHLTATQRRALNRGAPIQISSGGALKKTVLTDVYLDKRTNAKLSNALAHGKGKRIFGSIVSDEMHGSGLNSANVRSTLVNRYRNKPWLQPPAPSVISGGSLHSLVKQARAVIRGQGLPTPSWAPSLTGPQLALGTDLNSGRFLTRTGGQEFAGSFENHALQPDFNRSIDDPKTRTRGYKTIGTGFTPIGRGFTPIGGGFMPIGATKY